MNRVGAAGQRQGRSGGATGEWRGNGGGTRVN